MRLYLCFAQKGNQGTASTIGGSPSEPHELCAHVLKTNLYNLSPVPYSLSP